MRHPRTAASLTALAAASALLLTGCGGGDDGGSAESDKIEGAGNDKKSTASSSPSTKAPNDDFGTSNIKLPSDLKLTFDWKKPSDPEKAAALDGAADYMRAMTHGTVVQKVKDPLIAKHTVPFQSAQKFATDVVKEDVKNRHTATGEWPQYRAKVGEIVKGKLVEVSFCADQSKFFSKEIKTGKVLRTKPSDKDYMYFTLVMERASKSAKTWRARTNELKLEAVKECAR
ncbi:hypothetical protein GCM10009801_56640 [Streptomyces albiaxialis]|uniref:Lipoprotein n=1 Tax=Streptomyces albiaxialis TaxID=329523 RepID=A0ABN2WHV6_9ACTN